jgi:hypothetical protein
MKDKEVKGDGWVIPPMFEGGQARRRSTGRVKYVKPVVFYACPQCSNTKVGVILDGSHLVWRPHNRTTMSGAKMLCVISGAPLCANPPPNVLAIVHCPHR